MTAEGVVIYGAGDARIPAYMDHESFRQWEHWSLNTLWRLWWIDPVRITRWFDMHTWKLITSPRRGRGCVEWLSQQWEFPIYMPEVRPEVPCSVRFPREDAEELVGSAYKEGELVTSLWGNSFTYMIALAILERIPKIVLWGLRMGAEREVHLELPSLMFWIGQATARGHYVHVPTLGPVLAHQEYGYVDRVAPGWAPDYVQAEVEYDEGRGPIPPHLVDTTWFSGTQESGGIESPQK